MFPWSSPKKVKTKHCTRAHRFPQVPRLTAKSSRFGILNRIPRAGGRAEGARGRRRTAGGLSCFFSDEGYYIEQINSTIRVYNTPREKCVRFSTRFQGKRARFSTRFRGNVDVFNTFSDFVTVGLHVYNPLLTQSPGRGCAVAARGRRVAAALGAQRRGER